MAQHGMDILFQHMNSPRTLTHRFAAGQKSSRSNGARNGKVKGHTVWHQLKPRTLLFDELKVSAQLMVGRKRRRRRKKRSTNTICSNSKRWLAFCCFRTVRGFRLPSINPDDVPRFVLWRGLGGIDYSIFGAKSRILALFFLLF